MVFMIEPSSNKSSVYYFRLTIKCKYNFYEFVLYYIWLIFKTLKLDKQSSFDYSGISK